MHILKRNNTYSYRRRIPKILKPYLPMREFKKTLSEDPMYAQIMASKYDILFTKMKAGIRLGLDVSILIAELNIREVKQSRVDVYQMYLNTQDVSSNRLSKITRLLSILRELLPDDITSVNMTVLDKIKDTLLKMPKRSTSKYREMSIKDVVKVTASEDERMSTETINDHLKILNSLLKFSYERDVISKPYAVPMVKKTTTSRNEREALSTDTIREAISSARTVELADAYTLLYLTGLRPSEVSKCKVTTIDDIKCFDIRDTSLQLKTKSSHRLIPVHKLIDNPEETLKRFNGMSTQYISRQFKMSKGTLYSLRHSFATHLAKNNIEPHIISELLGHSHKGMTMSRYVKGLPIKLLKDAVDTLSLIA